MQHKLCPSCGFLNPSLQSDIGLQTMPKFCGNCANPLSKTEPNPQDSVYLDKRTTETPRQELDIATRGTAERRQLTVLFCDVVNSTQFTEKLDPEELRNLLEAYRAGVMEVVLAQNGHIARYFGDGILVYFGYPIAHEDAAHRAVRTALGIVAAIETLNPYFKANFDTEMQVRLSIETGLVVVWHMEGDDAPEPIDIVGRTPNIAARMQNRAEPNTIVIGNTTQQLIQGFFNCKPLGTSKLRGISQPVPLYQVSGEIPQQSRVDVERESGLTPLIGRKVQLQLMEKCWTDVINGKGHALLIEGEAGIGKSRCIQWLKEHVNAEAHILEGRGSPYYQNSPLYPILVILQQLLKFTSTDTPHNRLLKLEKFLQKIGNLPTETFPLLAELLFLKTPAHPNPYATQTLSPEQRRQQTWEGLVHLLLKVAERKPILFVVEDLHWIDPSTLAFLALLIARSQNARMLIALTCRSENSENMALLVQETKPSWTTAITLKRLTPKQVETMIQNVAEAQLKLVDKKPLTSISEDIVAQIVDMTEGVPLFVEELTRMVLEGNLITLTPTFPGNQPTEIPVTLQALLTARLDRLGPAKEIVQLGATLGREWTGELLQQLHALNTSPEARGDADAENNWLETQLKALIEAQILDQRSTPDNQVIYTFRHPLIRETAYQSLLKSTRQQYHQQIATVLTEEFGTIVNAQPELVAHHYTEAGIPEKAVDYWQQAGHRALERSANVEGTRHITLGLAALENLPPTPERARRELRLLTTIGPAFIATKGYASLEVEQTYTRARELLDGLDTLEAQTTSSLFTQNEDRQNVNALRFPVLFGLWLSYLVQGRLLSARELGEQCLVFAKQQHNPAFEVEAHRALGATLYYLSEFKSALAHLDAGLAAYQPQEHPVPAFLHYLADPGMTLLSYSAPLLWSIGYPEQAVRRIKAAENIGHQRQHPFSKVVSLHFATVVYQYQEDVDKVEALATQMLNLCQQHGFFIWEAAATVMKGWALAEKGQAEQGIAMIRRGISAWETTRAEVLRPLFLARLAQAYQCARELELALQTLDEAIDAVKKTGERMYLAELYRQKAECYKQQCGNLHHQEGAETAAYTNAETYFQRALAVAKAQGAKSWELRAAISLCQLWMRHSSSHTQATCSRKQAAYALLKPIYTWFSEGFDTPNLNTAKQLLNELEAKQ